MEKREPSSTVGGNVNWCNHYEKQYGHFLQKLKLGLSYDAVIPLPGKFPQKIIMRKHICTPMFIAALFTTAKTCKKQMFIGIGMDKKDMVQIYILLSHKKEQNNAICSNMDEPRDCHTE